jgi:hypothetical protein
VHQIAERGNHVPDGVGSSSVATTWNRRQQVGKRSPDLDPDLPLSQVIKEVQRRAKFKMRA